MAASPSPPVMSVEEYLRTDFEIGTEYVDGELIEKYVGNLTHNEISKLIVLWLNQHEQSHQIRWFTEQHLKIAKSRYRVPDILIMPAGFRREPILTEPPLCTIEIVSPDEPHTKLRAKLRDHQSMGVRVSIVIDPFQRTVSVLGESGVLTEQPEPMEVQIPTPAGPLAIPFGNLLSQLP